VAYDFTKRSRRAVRPSPIFLAFVALALGAGVAAWRADAPGSRGGDLAVFLMVVGLWVVSLSLHEFAHAYAAFRGGDRSVEAAGYLTLDPRRYAHPVLSIVLPLLFIVQGGIGLPGGAVYLHRHGMRSRAAQSLAAAAGPLTNAAFAAITLAVVYPHRDAVAQGVLLGGGFEGAQHARFWAGLAFFGFLQVTATVLNLLPIPGLDGWAIIEPYLDPHTAQGAEQVKPWGMIGVIVLLQINTLNTWFFDAVYRIFEASGIDRVAPAIGREFFRFWQKQPF
jgi:Zn-dependent protease